MQSGPHLPLEEIEKAAAFKRRHRVYGHFGLAQTAVTSEYYVVRDSTPKKCTIVDKRPTTTTTIVDNGVFKTKTEAETGMKTMKVCTEN